MKSKGFTLIELVVVITILGILAAVALPRFISLQGDARTAKLNAARGAVGAAAALIRGTNMVRSGVADAVTCPGGGGIASNNSGAAGTVCTDGGIVNMVFGAPSSPAIGTPGIISAAGLTSVFNPSAANLTAEGYTVTVAAGVTTIQIVGATLPGNCQFTYTQSTAAGASPVITAVVTSGCA
jgi:MSHA pilin protein MshA